MKVEDWGADESEAEGEGEGEGKGEGGKFREISPPGATNCIISRCNTVRIGE